MNIIKLSIYRLFTQLQLYSIQHINSDISRRSERSLIKLFNLSLRRPQFASFKRKNINIAKLIILSLLNLSLLSNFYSLAHVNFASLILVSNLSPRLIFMTMRIASEIAMSTRIILNYLLNFAVPL